MNHPSGTIRRLDNGANTKEMAIALIKKHLVDPFLLKNKAWCYDYFEGFHYCLQHPTLENPALTVSRYRCKDITRQENYIWGFTVLALEPRVRRRCIVEIDHGARTVTLIPWTVVVVQEGYEVRVDPPQNLKRS